MNRGMFSSKTDEWATPQWLFDKLDAEFHFRLDACATAENAKCEQFFTKEDNGLAQYWGGGATFCNPPYGRAIGKWVRKAWEQSQFNTVIMLIPARTDTAWWHQWVMDAHEIRFVKGRLRFSGAGPAPFPSAIVVFHPDIFYRGRHSGAPKISTYTQDTITNP